jgi:hypothetical protein
VNCAVCQRVDPAQGWTVCRPCLDRIDDDLAAIVTLTRAAAQHLTPETRPQGTSSSAKPGSRPPLDIAALDDAQAADALPLLESWERLTREHFQMAPYGPVSLYRARLGMAAPPATLGGVVAFLRAQLARIAETPDYPLDDLAREVHDQRARLNRHDDNRHARPAGIPLRCVAEHPDADGRTCGWGIRTNGHDAVTCPQCRTTYTPDQLLDAHDMELLPAAVLILLDDREPSAARKRIANWAARDRLTTHAHAPSADGGKPTPLYRLGEYRNLLTTPAATG